MIGIQLRRWKPVLDQCQKEGLIINCVGGTLRLALYNNQRRQTWRWASWTACWQSSRTALRFPAICVSLFVRT